MRKLTAILAALLALLLCLTGCGLTGESGVRKAETTADLPLNEGTALPVEKTGPIIEPQAIADYIFVHGTLPDNFITKKEAQALGWDSSRNDVSDVAPGKSIGGDYFGNYEGRLPVEQGVEYHEADCWYTGGKRNAYRVIYSNQGRVWYTEDHYETFTELFPTVPREGSEADDSR